jgi:hypothetical protein
MPINPGCKPPGSQCVAFLVGQLEETIGLSDPHSMAFDLTTPKKQNLELWIEISTDHYESVAFMTKGQKFPVHTGKHILVGLDSTGAKAAQPFFVSGNTVTLAVYPKDSGVTVRVGKIVNHGHKKTDPPRRGSR